MERQDLSSVEAKRSLEDTITGCRRWRGGSVDEMKRHRGWKCPGRRRTQPEHRDYLTPRLAVGSRGREGLGLPEALQTSALQILM